MYQSIKELVSQILSYLKILYFIKTSIKQVNIIIFSFILLDILKKKDTHLTI